MGSIVRPSQDKDYCIPLQQRKEYAAQSSEVNQMEAKEHDLIFDDLEEELEAKQHDLPFNDSEEEPEETAEANNFETIQVSDAESACKTHEDEGVNFDMMLQAQQANTRLQAHQHELLDSDSSDEESVADLKVNTHNLKPGDCKPIQGPMEFSDSDSEDEFTLKHPGAMEEALSCDARGEIDNPDMEVEESAKEKVARMIPEAKLPKRLLQFSDSEDEAEFKPQCAHMALHPPSRKQLLKKGWM